MSDTFFFQISLVDGALGQNASLNGVFVDGMRVAQCPLTDGAELIFGATDIKSHPMGSVLPRAKVSNVPYHYRIERIPTSPSTNESGIY
jgi:hypothetical protein